MTVAKIEPQSFASLWVLTTPDGHTIEFHSVGTAIAFCCNRGWGFKLTPTLFSSNQPGQGEADLRGADLRGADLAVANLSS